MIWYVMQFETWRLCVQSEAIDQKQLYKRLCLQAIAYGKTSARKDSTENSDLFRDIQKYASFKIV